MCLPAFLSPRPPFFLSYFPSFFLPLDELGSQMNISLENCHLCCWLRTGINVDRINIRRLDFFFFFTRKKKKNKRKACSCFQSTEVIQRCCKNRVFCSLPEPTLLLSTAPWSGFSRVYHVLIRHLFFISQRLCGQKAKFTFSLCQPKQQPTMSEKKRKQERNWQHYTLVLTL